MSSLTGDTYFKAVVLDDLVGNVCVAGSFQTVKGMETSRPAKAVLDRRAFFIPPIALRRRVFMAEGHSDRCSGPAWPVG